ncbi:MAG: etfB [Magnetococcales bacterium]|nr:etfB [Magnetococcales bacterium]HIJ83527.1 electron transfer flavoprotein subunit beta/FixA family protein [Magnetococcales bacterium]
MKVLVALKEVGDPAVAVHVAAGDESVQREGVGGVINPFDEIALEAAIGLKEQGLVAEVVAVSVGPLVWEGSLRTALAMGADRAILLRTDSVLEPLQVAKALAACAIREAVGLILLGRQGVDHDWGVTGPMTAGILGWPQATCVSRFGLVRGYGEVVREVDGGGQLLRLPLPAVVSCDLGLNTPRYASLPNIMKARSKPLEIRVLPQSADPSWEILYYGPPVQRSSGRRVASVEELAEQLDQAGVLP